MFGKWKNKAKVEKKVVSVPNSREALIQFVFDDTMNRYEDQLLKQLNRLPTAELTRVATAISEVEPPKNNNA